MPPCGPGPGHNPDVHPFSAAGLWSRHHLWNNRFAMRAGLLVGVLFWLTLPAAQPAAAQAGSEALAQDRGEAYRLFLRGRYLENEDDLDGAIGAYREAAELDRTSGEILAELASLYARDNRGEEAVAAARESLARESGNYTAHRILGLVHASRANSRAGTAADIRRAIDHLERARPGPLPDFQVELTLARLYLRDDAAQQAIDLLEELQKVAPGFSETGLLLARAYELGGRMADAVETLERVVSAGPPSSRALRSLAELYGRGGRWADAVEAYERAVDRNPRSARTRRELANALLQDGQAERARDVLDELVTMRPMDAAGLYLLSEVELELGNYGAAEAVARRLVEVEPDGLRGVFALAEVFGRRRQHRRVVETLEPLLAETETRELRTRQVAGLLRRVGHAYEQLQDYAAASRVYQRGVALRPAGLEFGARLAQAYLSGGRLDEARRVLDGLRGHHAGNLTVAHLEARVLGDGGDVNAGVDRLQDALRERSDEPAAYLVLASFYSQYERLGDAVELLESADRRFPDDTAILFQLGAVLERSDRPFDAEETFRRVLERDPAHAATLNYLGYMLADRGERLDESVDLLERAIELDPHNGAYLDSLGWAYFKLDRLDRAESLLQRAREQMAWNSVIQDHFGDLMLRLGRYADAIAAWESALAGDGDDIERSTIERKIGDARRRLAR